MLNRASRSAAAATNRNPTAHPRRPSGCSPHENDRIAGAMPNEITSASESSSMPKSLDGSGHPRDAPVEHVEHHREADERRGDMELAAHRVDDAGIAAEHVGDGEHARQQIDAAPKPSPGPVGTASQRPQHPQARADIVSFHVSAPG